MLVFLSAFFVLACSLVGAIAIRRRWGIAAALVGGLAAGVLEWAVASVFAVFWLFGT